MEAEVKKINLRSAERKTLERQLQEMRSFLSRLPSALASSVKGLARGQGQPRNVAASLVVMDLVEMFEWLTRTKALRRRHDTGVFWEFASAVWPVIFKRGEYGLHSAIKNWELARKRKLRGARSGLIANLDLRHPEWRLFDS
jgi:hypothetical protein